MTENEKGIFDAILQGDIDFASAPWPTISESAKDLVRKMLMQDPKKRITPAQVLGINNFFQLKNNIWFHIWHSSLFSTFLLPENIVYKQEDGTKMIAIFLFAVSPNCHIGNLGILYL